jgi:hypothetical protein
MSERRLKCALLTHYQYWPAEVLLACPGIELVALNRSVIGLPDDENPFGLPEDDRADVALVTAWWYRWLFGLHPDRADRVMREVERRTNVLVGLDGPDQFALTFPPSALKRFEVVLKFQGIYRDRDLYNYVVGPQFAGANWTEKLRPRRSRYDSADLEKLRLSVPSFMTEFPAIRRVTRARETGAMGMAGRRMSRSERLARDLGEGLLAPTMGVASGRLRTLDVHCLTGLSHVQRIEAMELLEGFSGTRGIAPTQGAAPALISGTEYGGGALPSDVARELADSARPFWRAQVGRFRFLFDLRRHRVVFAPTGYGELGNRHGLALLSGAALVCQDLSHVEMMLPLTHRENVAFCRPDLSDLRATIDALLSDDDLRMRIAQAGRRSYMAWARSWRRYLHEGIEVHVRDAVQAGRPPVAAVGATQFP